VTFRDLPLLPLLSPAFAVCLAVMPGHHASAQAAARVVVLVSVDGLANFYLDDPKA
jgi:hypothetical protein